jgi:hypothetical protein
VLDEGKGVIVRIRRARIRRDVEAEAFGLRRSAVGGGGATAGLEAFAIARRLVDGQLELMALTMWRDLDSLIGTMGPGWADPAWLPGLADLVESSSTEHYETVAESVRGLANLELTSEGLLEPTVGDQIADAPQ